MSYMIVSMHRSWFALMACDTSHYPLARFAHFTKKLKITRKRVRLNGFAGSNGNLIYVLMMSVISLQWLKWNPHIFTVKWILRYDSCLCVYLSTYYCTIIQIESDEVREHRQIGGGGNLKTISTNIHIFTLSKSFFWC